MNKYLTKGRIALLVIFSVLIADQIIKIYVKTHMYWHQSENAIKWLYEKLGMVDAEPPTWFYIYFTENNGMAFGMEIFGKLFLTLFRIVAVGAIGWYLTRIIKQGLKTGYIVCVSLILTGALGNIIDSAFYGMIFSDSYSQVATLFPHGGGYSSFLHGKVVDMLYFPLYEGFLPQWIPIWGGDFFVFFRPVFNLADSYITIGVFILLLFHRKFFASKK